MRLFRSASRMGRVEHCSICKLWEDRQEDQYRTVAPVNSQRLEPIYRQADVGIGAKCLLTRTTIACLLKGTDSLVFQRRQERFLTSAFLKSPVTGTCS